MKTIVILVFINVFFHSQYNAKAQQLEAIDIAEGMNKKGNLKLSDIAENIKYISLETGIENLISDADNIKFTEEFIFVKNINPFSLYVFNRSGKFIRQIGHKGHGPNEYNILSGFCIQGQNNNVYLYSTSPSKLLVYTIDGIFLKKYDCPIYQSQPFFDMEFFGPDKFIMLLSNYHGDTEFSYKIFSSKNELIKKAIKPIQFSTRGYFGNKFEFSYYTYNNRMYVKENLLNDTLYRVITTNEFQPTYIFKSGKYECPVEFRQNFIHFAQNKELKYILINKVFECKHYLLYSYSFNRKLYFDYYSKSLKKAFTFNSEGIPNDYDGGSDFYPIYQKNNEMIGIISSIDLIEKVFSEDFKNSTPKYPEKKKELEQLANRLNENDNPVLMLVKLKE